MTTSQISADERARFERDGFVVFPGIVPAETLASVRAVFEATVERLARQWFDEGFVTDTADDEPFETRWSALRRQLPPRFPTSWRKVLVSPAVYALWQEPSILGRIRDLVGDEVFAHGVWNGRPREAGNAEVQRVGWHQDAHYYKAWNASDGKLVTVWIPLVAVDAQSGCLQFAPGSHRNGFVPPVRSSNGLLTVDDAALGDVEPFTATMKPGDAVFFTDLTIHRALDNVSDHVRWSIDIRFGEASPGIMSKTPRGYLCHSADPGNVESFDTWAQRYEYGLAELGEELDHANVSPDLDAETVAKLLHTSRSELEVF